MPEPNINEHNQEYVDIEIDFAGAAEELARPGQAERVRNVVNEAVVMGVEALGRLGRPMGDIRYEPQYIDINPPVNLVRGEEVELRFQGAMAGGYLRVVNEVMRAEGNHGNHLYFRKYLGLGTFYVGSKGQVRAAINDGPLLAARAGGPVSVLSRLHEVELACLLTALGQRVRAYQLPDGALVPGQVRINPLYAPMLTFVERNDEMQVVHLALERMKWYAPPDNHPDPFGWRVELVGPYIEASKAMEMQYA